MAAGRKPDPTALKIARGTFRRDRHGDPASEAAGEAITAIPEPPETLSDVGKTKWTETAAILQKMGVLETRYVDALLMYCEAWDRLAEAEADIKKSGKYFVAESGYVCVHPALGLAKHAREDIRRYQVEFGMTPSSATKVKVSNATKKSGVPTRKPGLSG